MSGRCPICLQEAPYHATVWHVWMPAEEQAVRSPEADRGYGRAAGLALDRPVNVFVCRRCDGWPVRVVE